MLDKRCLSLLHYINGQCLNSGYKVFFNDELAAAMPKEFGMDKEGVKQCLKDIADREYISIKYLDDEEACLCPLTKGRLVFENKIDDEIVKARAEKRYFAFALIGAFTGSVVGSLFMALVFALAGVR